MIGGGGESSPIEAFAVVADGMGGLAAGEVASSITVEAAVDEIKSFCKVWPTLEVWIEGGGESHQQVVTTRLEPVLDSANRAVLEEARRDPGKDGMGTTCTAAAVSHGRLYVSHIGDSRAYLFRNGVLTQLTHDHSWVQEQVDRGNITSEEAWDHPRKNIITRAVGLDYEVHGDMYVSEIYSEDLILLCSDGLNTMLKDHEIQDIVASGISTAKGLQEICDGLVLAANESGGFDNTTVVLMEMMGH
jgi:protein phosphatase